MDVEVFGAGSVRLVKAKRSTLQTACHLPDTALVADIRVVVGQPRVVATEMPTIAGHIHELLAAGHVPDARGDVPAAARQKIAAMVKRTTSDNVLVTFEQLVQ